MTRWESLDVSGEPAVWSAGWELVVALPVSLGLTALLSSRPFLGARLLEGELLGPAVLVFFLRV
jgi:hypothetical protein